MGIFALRELAEENQATYTLEKPEAINERLMKSLRDGEYPVLIRLEKKLFRKTVLYGTVSKEWRMLSRALAESRTLEEETGLLLTVCEGLEKCREKGLDLRNLELEPERMYLTESGEIRMFYWPIVNRRESVSPGMLFRGLPLSRELSTPESKAFEEAYMELLKNPEQVTVVMVERFLRGFFQRQRENRTEAPVSTGMRQNAGYDPFAAAKKTEWPDTTPKPVSPLDAAPMPVSPLDAAQSDDVDDGAAPGGTTVLGMGGDFASAAPVPPPTWQPEKAPVPPPEWNPTAPTVNGWQTDAGSMQSPLTSEIDVTEDDREIGGTSVLGLGETFSGKESPAVPQTPATPDWPAAPQPPAAPDWPPAPAAPVWPPVTGSSPMEAAAPIVSAPAEEEAPTALLQEDSMLIRESTGEKIVLTGDVFTLGKRETCSYVIRDNKYVSHLHAELRSEAGKWVIRDKGSANKTRVDGKALLPETDEPLRDGCVIKLGSEVFRFVAGE